MEMRSQVAVAVGCQVIAFVVFFIAMRIERAEHAEEIGQLQTKLQLAETEAKSSERVGTLWRSYYEGCLKMAELLDSPEKREQNNCNTVCMSSKLFNEREKATGLVVGREFDSKCENLSEYSFRCTWFAVADAR